METLNVYCEELAVRFPWKDMENTVEEENFKSVMFVYKEFWKNINSTLAPHKEKNPIRCIEIIDFVGKCANLRKKNDATLAHFKSPMLAEMVLPYFSEAVRQKCNFSVTQLFILLDISFEHPNLRVPVENLLTRIAPDQIFVKDKKVEKELLNSYYYLYRKEVMIKQIVHKLGLN